MTVLLIMIFPALKHGSLILCVSLSSILSPKCFHSTVTIFKCYPVFAGVHSKYLVFPCPFLIFLLTHSLPWNHHGNNPMQKKIEKFPILLISMEFPCCCFSISVDVFLLVTVVWTVRKVKTSFAKANINLMYVIFLDSLSSLCAGKCFLQRQFRAVTSFQGEHSEINTLS